MRLKSLLLFLTIGFYSSVLAQTSISELKTPNKSTIDFTFNSVDKTSPTFSNGTIVDKVSYELNSLQKLFPRLFKVSSCQKDSYNTLYCPDALVKADEYWGYDQSEVISKKQTVIDFEQGTYQELTSTVRDFMDGFANTHNSTVIDYQTGSGTSNVGTVIDYQNGSSVKRTGFVVDYASKTGSVDVVNAITSTQLVCPNNTYPMVESFLNICGINLNNVYIDSQRTIANNLCKGKNAGCHQCISTQFHQCDIGPGTQSIINTCPDGYTLRADGKCEKSTLACPSGYTDNGTNCQKTVSFDFYQYTCPSTYSPINSGFTSYTKTDPNTSTENWNTLDDAVNSATAPVGNCQKTITYSYYKYNCPTGYTVRDGGLTSACPRTDPNKTINNESTLSQPCNNSTPPTGNCEKIIPYTFYSYECSSGYTAIDKGLATCTKTDSSTSTNTSSTLSQPCNSATPPKENCYKDISYKHYTYGCSPGYITDNYGLSNMEQYI